VQNSWQFGTWRAEIVGLVLAVAIADRHAAKQHLLGRQLDEGADRVVEPRPGLLRAGVEAVTARQECQRVDIAAEVGPLAGAELAVDRDEQRDGALKNSSCVCTGRESRRIVAVDAERAVELHAVLLAAFLVGAEHRLGIDRVFRLAVARIFLGDVLRDNALELGERGAGQRIDKPGLQIAARGGALRLDDQLPSPGSDRPADRETSGRRCGCQRLQKHP